MRLDRNNLLQYRDESGEICQGDNLEAWDNRRISIVEAMHEVMGPLPTHKRVPLNIQVEEESQTESYVRRLITYSSELNSRTPAYLLIPKTVLQSETRAPAALALHSTDRDHGHKVVVGLAGTRDNRDYGHFLAENGYVVIAPSYPLMGGYTPDLFGLGYVSGTMKAIWDNIRALDLLDTLPYVIPGKYGAIGHSLGGHNSIFTAAFDDRLKVIVTSCGFDSFLDYMNGDISGWTQDVYMPRLADYSPEAVPFDFHEVIALLAPRHILISAPLHDSNFKWQSVDRVATAARKIYELYNSAHNLKVIHPQADHDFPPLIQQQALNLMNSQLNPGTPVHATH